MTAVARRRLLPHVALEPQRNAPVAGGAAFVFIQTRQNDDCGGRLDVVHGFAIVSCEAERFIAATTRDEPDLREVVMDKLAEATLDL